MLTLLVALLLLYLDPAAAQVPPSQDPWYTAPPGFETTPPGSVLRFRPALPGPVGNSSAAYNILYRTTDSHYAPTWAVTTLFVPTHAIPNASLLLSYQPPYDSADVDASPSFSLYAADAESLSPIEAALGLGVYVTVPDYEGPLAAFTAGVISGHATLDAVRAVLSLSLGLDRAAARVALWGYSGGALASEWAAELAVQYAPDLATTLVGAALGGLTPNVTSVLESISGTPAAGLAPSSILGLTSQFPAAREYILSQLKPTGPLNRTGFLAALNYTLREAGVAYAGQDITAYFLDGMATFFAPQVQDVVNSDGIMGYHGVPQMPIFAYKAIHDEISRVADTDALVERYCGVGANILYQRNTVGNHEQEARNSIAMVEAFLASVLTGTYAETYKTRGCTVENVTRQVPQSESKRDEREVNGVFTLW